MKENNREIGERIFNVIKELELTVDKFADAVDTTKFRLYSYKAGKAEAPQDLLETLEEKLGINPKYIRKGEEPMFLGNTAIAQRPAPKNLELFGVESREDRRIPVFLMPVPAGSPSPIDDYIDRYFNIDKLFKQKSFIIKVTGDSMIEADIKEGDELLIDVEVQYRDNDIVIASVEGNLTLKRIKKVNGYTLLHPENPKYEPIKVDGDTQILGVVTRIMRTPK